MKLILVLILLFSLKGYSQNPDTIVGKWIKANKEDLIIEVFKVNDEYNGKVSWSKDNKKPIGFLMLENLRYNQKTKNWEGGIIHEPNSNRSYDATLAMQSDGTLEVSGNVLFLKIKRAFKRVR